MALGPSSQTKSTGEQISHFTGVRMRVVGAGQLTMTMLALDSLDPVDLVPFTLVAETYKEPFRLMNYKQQRAYLEFSTNDIIDEFFRINRIVLFGKQLWTEYPGIE